jgi:ubiquinone/menaquinone biosynthesis C-methylase UbiE
MTPLQRIRKRSTHPSVEILLKDRATTYNALASEYHLARFGDQPGRYDFEETRALVKDIVFTLLAGRSDDWLALDLACGTGKIATTIVQAGGRVVALDAAMEMLHQCSANTKEVNSQNNLILTNASAGNLPYKDNSFDIVFSSRFLHLFPTGTYLDLIREMTRVVKPGGYVAIEMKNRWYGVGVYWVRDWWHAIKGGSGFSSYVSTRQLPIIARQIGGISLQSIIGLLLPKGWWLTHSYHLTQIARMLARGPLKSTSAHLVAIYRKD